MLMTKFLEKKFKGAISAFINISTMWNIKSIQMSFWSKPEQFEHTFSGERYLLINSYYGRR
ncbi:hypothetical protein AOG26_10565 [Pseudoalteromonas sp. UCD-33C]|nr:hypothetical protein AOG26_10565 [Pseudoalteromonas sp. UCD-33C]